MACTFRGQGLCTVINSVLFKRSFCISPAYFKPNLENTNQLKLLYHNQQYFRCISVANYASTVPEDETNLKDIWLNNRISNSQRLKILDKHWNKLKKENILPESQFIYKLLCLKKCKAEINPKEFLSEVKETGIDPSERLLKFLLEVVAERGDPGYVATVVNSMKSRNYPADDHVFSSLIISHAVKGDMRSVRQVWETIKEARTSPGPLTYTSLLRAAAMAGDYAFMLTTRSVIDESNITLCEENILSILETIVRSGKDHLAPCIKSYISSCSLKGLLNLVDSLLYTEHPNSAYSVLKLIKSDDNEMQYKDFVQNMLTANTPVSDIASIGKKMHTDGIYERALYDILNKLMKTENVKDAVLVFKTCFELKMTLRPHFFWPLIVLSHQQEGNDGVFSTLELMKDLKVEANSETLTDIVLPRLSLNDSDATLRRIQDKTGLNLSSLIVPFSIHLLRAGLLEQAFTICNQYVRSIPSDGISALVMALAGGYRNTKDHVTTAKLIQLLNIEQVGNWLLLVFSTKMKIPSKECLLLLQELKKVNGFISTNNERQLVNILSRMQVISVEINNAIRDLVQESQGGEEVYNPIPHPSNMSTSELECHLVELESKRFNTRGVLRKLVQQHCKMGNVEEARRFYKRLLDQEAQLSPGIISSMLQVNVLSGEIDDALEFAQKLKEEYPTFKIDCFKIIDLATLLIKNQRLDDALRLLHSNPQKHVNLRNSENWERNCWELLTAAAKFQDESAVKDVLNALLVNNYCLPTNIILGPLVRIHLSSGNVEKAVKTFGSYARDYKRTPLQQEIMCAAVASGNSQLLDDAVFSISIVHGAATANAAIAVSHALAGNTDQLKSFLQECSVQFNELLQNRIRRMKDLGQIEALQTLLIVFHDISHPDLNLVIDSILYNFDRMGDTDGAIKMWSILESKNIELSEKQKTSLAALVAGAAKVVIK